MNEEEGFSCGFCGYNEADLVDGGRTCQCANCGRTPEEAGGQFYYDLWVPWGNDDA